MAGNPEDSLDRNVTRVGDLGRKRPPDSSLGDLVTGADLGKSISDLSDLAGDLESAGDLVDLAQRYDLADTIGAGGMGTVLRATDRRLKRPVAIKRLKSEFGRSKKALQRFLTEATSVAALNHYNVVQIYDFGRDATGPYLVMELVDGKSLADRLEEGSLPLQTAIDLTVQLCGALQAAHDRGIVHRDVKPANILLTPDGIPKLTDFGLARQERTETAHTQAGTILGTLDFMSPEQRKDASAADARSDQWSLAATFYQMVTGELPRVIDGGAIPEQVRDVVLKALKSQPTDRYPSVRDFGDSLQHAVADESAQSSQQRNLKDGQCGQCGRINDPSRKFCKDCGVSLLTSCPVCQSKLPVWERFCGECGADTVAAIAQMVEAAQALKGEAQSLRTRYLHEEALGRLKPLAESSHPELAQYRSWAEEIYRQLSEELQKLQGQREELIRAAREQIPLGNLNTARQYLSQIPQPLQTIDSKALLDEIAHKSKRVKSLAEQIQHAATQREYAQLETLLDEFLKLKPGDDQARKLLAKVRTRIQPQKPAAAAREAPFQDLGALLPQQPLTPAAVSVPRSLRPASRSGKKAKSRVFSAALVAGLCLLAAIAWGVFRSLDKQESAADFQIAARDQRPTDPNATPSGRVPGKAESSTSPNVPAGNGSGSNSPAPMNPNATETRNRSSTPVLAPGVPAIPEGQPPAPTDSTSPTKQPAAGQQRGTPLFNGVNLSGWTRMGNVSAWSVTDGVIQADGEVNLATPHWLSTNSQYSDFILSLEYRLPAGGNSGVFLRKPRSSKNASEDGIEIQILDDASAEYASQPADGRNASIYRVVAPKPVPTPAGQWHRLEIRAQGKKIAISVNDQKVIDANLENYSSRFKEMPGLQNKSGYIGLQYYGRKVEFRELRIQDLAANPPVSQSPAGDPRLQGSWEFIGGVHNGRTLQGVDTFQRALTFDAQHYSARQVGKAVQGLVTVNTGTVPPEIEFLPTGGDVPQSPGHSFPGIYQVTSTTLKVCTSLQTGQRPTDFSSTPNSETAFEFYRRPIAKSVTTLPTATDWSQWRPVQPSLSGNAGWLLEEGTLIRNSQTTGDIRTVSEFTDFEMNFEYLLGARTNSGVFLYGPRDGETGVALEISLVDNANYRSAQGLPITQANQRNGALYGITAPRVEAENRVDQWNQMSIRCIGSILMVVLNGKLILDEDLSAARYRQIDKGLPGIKRGSGWIGFQNHVGNDFSVRHLEIKDLKIEPDWSLLGQFSGQYRIDVVGGQNAEPNSYEIDFTVDGSMRIKENSALIIVGKWFPRAGRVLVTWKQENLGRAEIMLTDPNHFVAERFWPTGVRSLWTGKRITGSRTAG